MRRFLRQVFVVFCGVALFFLLLWLVVAGSVASFASMGVEKRGKIPKKAILEMPLTPRLVEKIEERGLPFDLPADFLLDLQTVGAHRSFGPHTSGEVRFQNSGHIFAAPRWIYPLFRGHYRASCSSLRLCLFRQVDSRLCCELERKELSFGICRRSHLRA